MPGSYATAGSPVMVVVADSDLWIEANFKETELTHVRPGQPATVELDTYPDTECTGTVDSIAQATGAEFAVLPAQNAIGQLGQGGAAHAGAHRRHVPGRRSPLRVGMSTDGRGRHRPQPARSAPSRGLAGLRPVERAGRCAAAAGDERRRARRPVTVRIARLITVAIMLATIMQALDTTIANVALPTMQGSCRRRRTGSPGC